MDDRRDPLPDRTRLAESSMRIRCAVPGCDRLLNAKDGGNTVIARGALPSSHEYYTNSGFMQPGEECLLRCSTCNRDLEPFITDGAASRTAMSGKERDYWEAAARTLAGGRSFLAERKSQPEALTEAEEAFFSQERIPCAVSGCDQRFSRDDLRVDLTLRGTVPPRVRVESEEGQPVCCAMPNCDRETRGLEWFDLSQCVRYADRGVQHNVYTSWIEAHPEVTLGTDLETGKPIDISLQRLCSGSYILGVQGVGKSTLLEQIACQLLEQDESVIVFDPHGQLIDNIVRRMPRSRLRDTFHLDLKDREYPFALNVFACADPDDEEERDRTRNRVTHAFEKLWPETQRGVYVKKLLRHVIILLIEHPGLTLQDVPRLLRDGAYRAGYTDRLRNAGSRDFWQFDYDALAPARQITESTPLLTRVDELLAEPVIQRILCQPHSTIDLRALIEARQNLFVTLPINEDAYARAAGLVGVMLMSLVYAATFSFADLPEAQRPGFSLIVDEFQNFATDEYAKLFSQGRKFGVKQFLAHQYRGQLGDTEAEATKDATLSAFTKVIFRVTEPDSRALGSLFVDLEKRRQPTNLAIEVLDKLERHPSPVVKEFTAKYVWPLRAGAKDRVGTRKRFIYRPYTSRDTPLRGDADELKGEMSYERWRDYVLNHDGITWGTRTSRLWSEYLKRVENPRLGFDYDIVPDYPKRDFGAGEVTFIPTWAQEALQVLNLLLYEAQKSRLGCAPLDDAETQLSPAQYRQYQENLSKAQKLDGLLGLILRFDDWADVAATTETEEQYRQLLQDTVQGKQPRNVIESCHRLFTWRAELQAFVAALVREPITQGASDIRAADVALSLQRLPLRQAYVRIGTQAHVMKTQEMAPGVDADEERERRLLLREQTRRQLCRPVATIRQQPDGGGDTRDVQAPAKRAAQQAPPADAPHIRRFRPLP